MAEPRPTVVPYAKMGPLVYACRLVSPHHLVVVVSQVDLIVIQVHKDHTRRPVGGRGVVQIPPMTNPEGVQLRRWPSAAPVGLGPCMHGWSLEWV